MTPLESLWQVQALLEEQPKPAPLREIPRHELPTTGSFFEFPSKARLDQLTQARLFERYKENWRTPRSVVSVALDSENPKVRDPAYLGSRERASHDGLISNTFGFHPAFGTGHVLRTNGVIAMFWNGEEVNIVELKNIEMLRVLLDGERKASQRAAKLAAAMLED